jgi:hypothetical protein
MAYRPPTEKKPKLTDDERHKRFVETAKKVGASENLEDFDRAFERVVKPRPSAPRSRPSGKPTSS